jgi:acyl-CoA reductase-like NAD-dependent aldehyde dehydrogenase
MTERSTRRLASLKSFALDAGLGSHVGGELVAGRGETVELVDPCDGETWAIYPDAGEAVVDQAMQAASGALTTWQALTASARGRLVWQVGQKVRERLDDLAQLETLTTGKPIRDTRAEVLKVAEMFEYYAGWCDKLHGQVIPVPTSHLNYTRREPLGVVVQITPWNAPIFTAGWQIAPAIAAGNAVVIKPSELTPASTLALARLAEEAGLPKGLVNVLAGLGQTTGEAAVTHAETRLVVFVGSPRTGALIAAAAARNTVPTILELGGKSANIVFADADLDRAALGAQAAIWSGAGQSCVAGSRLVVDRRVQEQLLDRLATAAGRLVVGAPEDEATAIGPILCERQWRTVDGMVEAARQAGARVRAGGGRPAHLAERGCYFAPTLIDEVRPDMAIARDEVFGPVLTVLPFDDEEEAIAIANGTRFGLAGAVWTQDVGRAHRVAAAVRAGTFWVNGYKTISVMSPFGGFGASGHGRSSGEEALLAYTQTKSVWIETAAEPPAGFGYGGD